MLFLFTVLNPDVGYRQVSLALEQASLASLGNTRPYLIAGNARASGCMPHLTIAHIRVEHRE
jgi:hypothetical protein